jgi:hypothetical protein
MAGDNKASPRVERGIRAALNPEVANEIVINSTNEFQSMLDLDLSTLDPNFTYRFANVAPLKVARWKARGYTIVDATQESGIRNAVGDAPEAEDGTYRVGDLVLMKVPKTLRKARRRALAKKRDQRLKGPEKQFRHQARKKGRRYSTPVEVITDKE